MKNVRIVIPARRNSKGLPFKNRKLFQRTINTIPKEFKNLIIVNTDDEVLKLQCIQLNIDYYSRPEHLGLDETSTKDVFIDMHNNGIIKNNEIVIMLYLTYPKRTWEDIFSAYNFFINKKCKSLLCKKEIKGTHPYLYMIECDNYKGKQLRKHNLYRRQDYPSVFEISHNISIFKVSELMKLNNNLYNKNTLFYPVSDVIDVDTIDDLLKSMNDG